jgi:hypothetical protein
MLMHRGWCFNIPNLAQICIFYNSLRLISQGDCIKSNWQIFKGTLADAPLRVPTHEPKIMIVGTPNGVSEVWLPFATRKISRTADRIFLMQSPCLISPSLKQAALRRFFGNM